jgi:hypothetical protein
VRPVSRRIGKLPDFPLLHRPRSRATAAETAACSAISSASRSSFTGRVAPIRDLRERARGWREAFFWRRETRPVDMPLPYSRQALRQRRVFCPTGACSGLPVLANKSTKHTNRHGHEGQF